jgi:hypothetical protein
MKKECLDCRYHEPIAKRYQLVIMDTEGKTTYGKTFTSWQETFEAMIELRNTYAKMEINHHVGYREV